METVTTICVFLVMFEIGQTNASSKPGIYNHGDNATVLIKNLATDLSKSLDIYFHGFTNKLHYTHVMLYVPNTTSDKHISRNYTGRINSITMDSGNLSFLLLNVKFMDSGNYTAFEGSWEKGKGSILVSRRILTGQVNKPMILHFMCNNINTSSIKISRSHDFDYATYIMYNVGSNSCTYTNVSMNYMDRVDSCVLNDVNFILTLRELRWSDKGAYTAWDDHGFLLESIFLGVQDSKISSTQGPKEENGMTIWFLISTAVVVLVATCLAFIGGRKFQQWKGKRTKKDEIPCSDTDLKMGPTFNTSLQSDDNDEMIYQEPRSNEMELTAYLEPISHPVHVYEKLHPYENQGNNMYRSLRPENII